MIDSTNNSSGRKSHRNASQWTPEWDLTSVPFKVLQSAYKSAVARMGADKSGRPRECGHVGDYVEDCYACDRAKAKKESRRRLKENATTERR
jgi:hypothetical protein